MMAIIIMPNLMSHELLNDDTDAYFPNINSQSNTNTMSEMEFWLKIISLHSGASIVI